VGVTAQQEVYVRLVEACGPLALGPTTVDEYVAPIFAVVLRAKNLVPSEGSRHDP